MFNFEKIKNWFSSWFKAKVVEATPDDFILSINFKMLIDGSLENAVYWNYESDKVAVLLGRLLYTITSNALNDELISILKKNSDDKFTDIVIASWNQMIEEHGPVYNDNLGSEDDIPIVEPDQFLNNLKRSIE